MDNQETLTRIADTLDELLAWTRLQAIDHARTALARALTDDQQKVIYQASTGASSREVAAIAGVGDTTVSRNWKRLFRAGLMHEDKATKGRYIRTFDLADFDMLPAAASVAAEGNAPAADAKESKSKKPKAATPTEGNTEATTPAPKPKPKKTKEPPAVTLMPTQA